jgi:O-antigen/teichoic acid export membrane protein
MALLIPGYAVPGVASFLSVPLLFATLGAAEYGRWALLYGIAAGVPQITTSWVEQRLVRFGHRWGRSTDRSRVALAVAASLVVSVILATIVVPRASVLDVAAAATLTALVSSYVLLIATLQSALAFGSISAAATVRSVLGSALGVVAAATTGSAALAIYGMAAGYAVGEVIGWLRRAPSAAAMSSSRDSAPSGASPTSLGTASSANVVASPATARAPSTAQSLEDGSLPPERTSYGVASAVAAVGAYELSVGDRFLLAALRPLGAVGGYAATYSLIDLVGRFVPSVVIGAMRPRLFRAWDAGVRGDVSRTAASVAALMMWVVASLVAVLALAARFVGFLPVDPVLVWPIGIGFACFMAANTVALAYSAATRQVRLAAHVAGAAVANIVLNLLLIPPLGAFGAAAATALSYGLLLALNLSPLSPGWFDRFQLAVLAPTAAAFAALLVAATTGSSAWTAAAVVFAGIGGLPAVTALWRLSRSRPSAT